jgi:hypothetical protein
MQDNSQVLKRVWKEVAVAYYNGFQCYLGDHEEYQTTAMLDFFPIDVLNECPLSRSQNDYGLSHVP